MVWKTSPNASPLISFTAALSARRGNPPAGTLEAPLKVLNPRFNLEKVKAVIFDIDGTLYSLTGSPFVKRYMELAKDHLSPEAYPVFQSEWNKAVAGKSPFRSGRVYDETGKKVLVLGKDGKVVRAFEPWGGEIPRQEISSRYPEPVRRGKPGYVFMEGGTWVLTGLARSFGIEFEENEKMYGEIYNEIFKNPGKYFQSTDPDLTSFFSKLKNKGCKIIVMSNTPEPMAGTILEALGARKNVDLFLPAAKKPASSRANLESVMQTFGLKPHEVLSVGDSVGNDIAVPHAMGMQTVLLEDFPVHSQHGVDAKGKSIASLIEAFKQTWREKAA